MKKKVSKIDVLRWVIILPVAIGSVLLSIALRYWIGDFLSKYLEEDIITTVGFYLFAVISPILIMILSYRLAPKYKLESTLAASAFISLILLFLLSLRDEYQRHYLTQFTLICIVIFLIGLMFIQRIERKMWAPKANNIVFY